MLLGTDALVVSVVLVVGAIGDVVVPSSCRLCGILVRCVVGVVGVSCKAVSVGGVSTFLVVVVSVVVVVVVAVLVILFVLVLF